MNHCLLLVLSVVLLAAAAGGAPSQESETQQLKRLLQALMDPEDEQMEETNHDDEKNLEMLTKEHIEKRKKKETILEKLDDLSGMCGSINEKTVGIEKDMEEMKQQHTSLGEDVKTILAELKALKDATSSNVDDMAYIKGQVDSMSAAIGSVNQSCDNNDNKPKATSCAQLLREGNIQKSSVLSLRTPSGKDIEVFCDVDNGYTFISPKSLSDVTVEDIDAMVTDHSKVKLRFIRNDDTQTAAVAAQLPQYSQYPLKLGLNVNYDADTVDTDYTKPLNTREDALGTPYLYLGFIPVPAAQNTDVQGISINGEEATFTNCDKRPNNCIAFFANPDNKPPLSHGSASGGLNTGVCKQIIDKSPTTDDNMPNDFFYFTEWYFGGCGCYGETDPDPVPIITGGAVGFI